MEIEIRSRSFGEGESIPSKFTCDGVNVSPHLSWESSVEGIKTFVVIVEDPDASSGNFTHWVVYNIPVEVNTLMENSTPTKNVRDEVLMGTNDFGRIGYGGPCPSFRNSSLLFQDFRPEYCRASGFRCNQKRSI